MLMLRAQATAGLRALSRPRSFASAAASVDSANSSGLQEKLVALCRHRGFVFPGSDIYGGLANSFDYGPLGTTNAPVPSARVCRHSPLTLYATRRADEEEHPGPLVV